MSYPDLLVEQIQYLNMQQSRINTNTARLIDYINFVISPLEENYK